MVIATDRIRTLNKYEKSILNSLERGMKRYEWMPLDQIKNATKLSESEINYRLFAELASLMRAARAVVAVDTGLGHLAAALGRPCVSLYGPTRTALIGATGPGQRHVCAPGGAMDAIAPESVWPALAAALEPS